MTPEYAKAERGRIWLNGPMGWEPHYGLYCRALAEELKSLNPIAHAEQIRQIEAALEGHPHK